MFRPEPQPRPLETLIRHWHTVLWFSYSPSLPQYALTDSSMMQSNHSFNGSAAENFSRIPESPHGNAPILNPWSAHQQNKNQNRTINQMPFGLLQQSPNFHRATAQNSLDTDGDAIFNDFAVMDAMEWYVTHHSESCLVNQVQY
ncbi:hypothetical protein OCU04_011045 [Sclerotinia nivalis]|uniref:Uncharacterized protein n=1 Tax=Sclerotinia nivalis TaxID=352851 RepID=A0A9X0ADB7_9HELO|nr:hypothetical protein OCU04_011045 [Sclerotinia nivalis]